MATLLARGQITIAAIRDGAPGPQGKPGKPGKDAVSIIVEDAPLVFDTDDNGIVSPGTSKTAKVKVMKGNQNVSNQCIGVSSRDDMCVNCKCYVTQEDGYITVSVSGNIIAKDDVVVDGVNHVVSATSGYAVAQAAYDGVTYFAQVPFSINVAKFTGIVAFDNKSYKSKFKEVSNRLDGAATKDELTQAKSEIEQTAREISLSVSEKSIARRNLLAGSDFKRKINDFIISNTARIEMTSGYNGTNCIKVIDDTDGTSHYIGVYWDGSQGGRSIRIEKGKKYIISCYYKSNDINANLYLEAIYTDKQTNAKRLVRATNITPMNFKPKKVNEWQLCTTVIDTKDAKSDYIAFNFWEYCNNKVGRIVAYICRPMVEEGNTYNGWTLSDKDYDYVGANLIDNSRTLDVGGNVYAAKGQKTLVGDAYELTASGSDDYNTFYRIKGSAFKLYTDYTISFEVRGDAKCMGVYVVYPVTNTKFTCYTEQQNGMMTEADGDGKTVGYVALVEVKELSKQQRVWGHFRFKDRLPEELYFQFPKNAKQTDVTSWNVTITKPKIEVGAVVTEYTERKSDLVDKASLKKAGIEVKSDEVLLYGDRIRVDNNGQTAAMFIGGKLNASLIDADKIEVKHLWAKSEDGITKVGYFGNYEIDACKVNNANAPLFVGADTAAKSPFYVTNEGHMVSTSATLGCFLLDKTSLRYISGYDDEEPGFALYNNYMLFREYSRTLNPNTHTWKSERKRTVWLGEYRTTYQLPALLSNLLIDDSFSADDDTLKSGIRISVTGCNDKYQYEDNKYNGVFQSKVYGNFAIYAEHGMYAGFRPMTRTINRSMELTDMDCFVIVTKGVTITLPAKPQRGQYYKFLQTGDNFVIKSSLNNMFWYGVGKNSFTSGALNQTTELIYDGSNWNVNWFIGK
jgi:hypothetical protein